MMISLDTSELKKIRIRLDAAGQTKRMEAVAYADAAFAKLGKLLAGKKINALGVVAGPGAFSATRTGVALINALAYGLGVPVVALTREQFDSPAPLPAGGHPPVAVVYGSLPNITIKKKLFGKLGAA